MFTAALQRRAQEDRLAKKEAKKPYNRLNQAPKLVFKPSALKATIKSAAAFDAFRQTRDVKALFAQLHHIILAAHFVSPSCFDPEFIGSQIIALIMAEHTKMNAQGLLAVGAASIKVKRANERLKRLLYNKTPFKQLFDSLKLVYDFDFKPPTFRPRKLPKVTAKSLRDNTNEESLLKAIEDAEVARSLGPAPFSADQMRTHLYRTRGIKIGRKLGGGSFGEVFVAEVINTGQRVAVKTMQPGSLESYKNVKAELDHSIAASNHPRFPTFFDSGITVGGVEYFVMELGFGDLFDLRLNGQEWDHGLLAFYGRQLLEALAELARLDICHRDLKPENIVLDARGNLLLADMGLSGLSSRARTACGTPGYLAPEVLASGDSICNGQTARGHLYKGTAADLWACGKILYVLHHKSMGNDPEEFESNMQALYDGSEADRQLCDVIDSLMRDNPAARPTAAQLLKHKYWNLAYSAEDAALVSGFEVSQQSG